MADYFQLCQLKALGALTAEQELRMRAMESTSTTKSTPSKKSPSTTSNTSAPRSGGARSIVKAPPLKINQPSWWENGDFAKAESILLSILPPSHAAPPPLDGFENFRYPPPSNKAYRNKQKTFPSLYNALTFTSTEIPSPHRIFYATLIHHSTVEAATGGHIWSSGSIQRSKLALAAISDASKASWGNALRAYLDWAGMEGIEDRDRFPISLGMAKMFLSTQVGIFSVDGLRSKMSNLRDYCERAMMPLPDWGWNMTRLNPSFNAIAAHQPHPKLKRRPLLSKQFNAIYNSLDLDNELDDPFHLAMLTSTVVGFTCLLRSGEFTFKKKSPSEEELAKKPKGRHVTKIEGTNGYNILLPWDKVKKWEGTKISVIDGILGLNGGSLLGRHLGVNQIGKDDDLFSYVAGKGKDGVRGTRVYLNKTSWLNWFNCRLAAIGEAPLSGHSIRIGGATQMLLNGVNPSLIKTLGRWSANASFYKYWREVNSLVALRVVGMDNVDVPDEEDVNDLVALRLEE